MEVDNHIFQGLRRDNHQIKQKAEFLWDARNIRITNRDDNTLFSITNERGTSGPLCSLVGHYVGHCVVGDYLIVFTAGLQGDNNYIYRIKKGTNYKAEILFHEKEAWEHSWSPYHPIETLGVYENELVQKVYWIDGINQPRVINVVKDSTGYAKTSFDFVQTLTLNESVIITKKYGEGSFSPGVIQYAFTYYNKYGQESNIFYTSQLMYITPKNRGGNPEEKVTNSFIINAQKLDTNFEYLRIYSIHRTSIDATPTVKRVIDIPLESESAVYTDSGTSGETVDPTFLLYVGGREIAASSMCAKDNTLFFGNIKLKTDENWLSLKDRLKFDITISDSNTSMYSKDQSFGDGKYYDYDIDLNNRGFMTGEIYRCGVQFQSSNGTWTEPIFLGDIELNDTLPFSNSSNTISWSSKRINIPIFTVNTLLENNYVRARACVVFPTMADRTVLCQGVLCPTVYNVGDRAVNAPYAMSSWFFRPQVDKALIANDKTVYQGASIQFAHNRPLYTGGNRGAEVQCTPDDDTITDIRNIVSLDKGSSYFFVDTNLVTMHSPDIEFDTSLQNLVLDEDYTLNILGYVELGAVIGDIDIQTSSPAINTSTSSGFIHQTIGYQVGTKNTSAIGGGLVSGGFYRDSLAKNDGTSDNSKNTYHMVYPWLRSGSVNNANRISESTKEGEESRARSAVLSKKKISNLKFFNTFTKADNPLSYNISTPQLFSSNEMSLVKVWVDYLNKDVPYYGNVDTIVSPPNTGYNLYKAEGFDGAMGSIASTDNITANSTDPVRIKYKSTPHLVFSLKAANNNEIELLPSLYGFSNNPDEYAIPSWDHTAGPVAPPINRYITLNRLLDSDSLTDPKDSELGHYALRQNSFGEYVVYIATDEGIKYSWSAVEAINMIDRYTVFKVTGDGNSCLVSPGNKLVNTGLSTLDYYTGTDIYLGVQKITYNEGYVSVSPYIRETESAKSAESTKSVRSANGVFRLVTRCINNGTTYKSTFNPFLILAELRRKTVVNRFGGTSESAIRNNVWVPASDPVNLQNLPASFNHISIPIKYGDTWCSRYDCLKTYPFTQEDENSIVEIGSFMCETRVNLDGRYDRNRGQISNLNMSPQNFNLINEVYSQKDNFFTYRIYDDDYYKVSSFPNQITWSLTKASTSDTDLWTNITLSNTLDLNGNKGAITSLDVWNEFILCFQEEAVNQILFNSRVQVQASDGVPIEIANGGKVEGSRLINGSIGCTNKWSIMPTTSGVYFLDSSTDDIYLFNGQVSNLTRDRGMNWWSKDVHTTDPWIPWAYSTRGKINGIRSFYDKKYGDIYFSPGRGAIIVNDALCYSEQLSQFTSLMSYGGVQAMFNFNDGFYSLRDIGSGVTLYQNNVGEYNWFYNSYMPWSLSFISNQNPNITKVFDTIELQADSYSVDKDGETLENELPINYIEVENEYQNSGTVAHLENRVKKKFRVWRGILPRNSGTRQRIRNPWAMISIGWEPIGSIPSTIDNKKAIVHNVAVKYTV